MLESILLYWCWSQLEARQTFESEIEVIVNITWSGSKWAPCLLWTQLCNLQLLLPPSMLLSPSLWQYHNLPIWYFLQHENVGYWEWEGSYTLGQSWTKTSLALVALLPICFSQSCTWERTFSRTKYSGFLPVGQAPRLVSQLDQPKFCKGNFDQEKQQGFLLNSNFKKLTSRNRGLFWILIKWDGNTRNLRVKSAARCFRPSPTTTTLLNTLIWQ